MTKRFFTVAVVAVLAMVCASQMHAAVATELVLSDGTNTATIDVSTTNVLTITCVGTCGNVATKTSTDGAHGTISVTGATFGNFKISATGVGGDDSTLPTLQDLNQIDAQSNAAGGMLTATFTDTLYPNISSLLDIADSNVTDQQIASSTIEFKTFSDAGNAIPAGTMLTDNTLTGHSDHADLNVANPNLSGSLTSETFMHFTGAGSIQANITIANLLVPEPASIVFLGTMVLGLTGLIRRKQVKRP